MKHIAIIRLTEDIVGLCMPSRIYLYSAKMNLKGELSSFKLCVIVRDDTDKRSLESTIYLTLDCELPYDVLLYTESEWSEASEDDGAFAHKILQSGELLYEQK